MSCSPPTDVLLERLQAYFVKLSWIRSSKDLICYWTELFIETSPDNWVMFQYDRLPKWKEYHVFYIEDPVALLGKNAKCTLWCVCCDCSRSVAVESNVIVLGPEPGPYEFEEDFEDPGWEP